MRQNHNQNGQRNFARASLANFSLGGHGSLVARLLWPVNIISFVLLTGLCLLMVARTQSNVDSAMRSKAEGIANFLQTVAQKELVAGNHTELTNFANFVTTDTDFAYVVFYDQNDKALTDAGTPHKDHENVYEVRRSMMDPKKGPVGSVVVGLYRERVSNALWSTAALGFLCLLLVQVLLSWAIFKICNKTIAPLHNSLARLSKTTSVMSSTSSDISKFSEALSSGVQQQAEVVQETTAAMTEMSSMLGQTSNYAKHSEGVMTSVNQKANNGITIMNQMVDSMTSIQQANEQLQQMSEIIEEIGNKTNVINDIVFKTQLLSFNASIEAARAGAHGRGFAVVAEEVGNLAKMSGKAAQEIASLLRDSEKQVGDIVRSTSDRVSVGRSVTEQAMRHFKEIATDINMISSQIVNISSAAREQELGVAQTNQAMSELNKTTDLASQIVQQATEASRILASEVLALTDISHSIEGNIIGNPEGFTAVAAVDKAPSEPVSEGDAGAEPGEEGGDVTTGEMADKIVKMAKKNRHDRRTRRNVS